MPNTSREPKNWVVIKRDRSYYVQGLAMEEWPDTMLLSSCDGGDVCCPCTAKLMHRALYDLFQVTDELVTGDTFTTPHGLFVCEGVHVLTVEESPAAKKARRARLRRLARRG